MLDEEVVEIIWLDDPKKWDYLRETHAERTRPHGSLGNYGWKTVGYENVRKKGKGYQFYARKIWYLQKWDAGCPDNNGGYSSKKMPVEAVKPGDIDIPKGIRIIEAYKIDQSIPTYSRTSKKNKIWREAKKEDKPFVAIHKYRDYAKFEYDMYTTNYNLKEGVHDQIKTTFLDFLKNLDRDYRSQILPKGSIMYGLGPVSGTLTKMRIFECQMLANKLKPLILDENNWTDI